MSSAQTPDEIQASLAKPGAGIPLLHRLVNRYFLVPFVLKKKTWEENEIQFKKGHAKVKDLLQAFPHARLTERVLVPPQTGLEDSSRYWSAVMVARHLVIVGSLIEKAVIELSHQRKILVAADIGKVKPEIEYNDPLTAASTLDEYFRFGDGALDRIHAQLGDPNSQATHIHPWFGPMTAKNWLWILGIHQWIHFKQLKNIQNKDSTTS